MFKDVDSIELGDDFVEVITRAVGSCDVLLALIGDQWVTIADERRRRRLDDPNDFVRLEIEAALSRGVRLSRFWLVRRACLQRMGYRRAWRRSCAGRPLSSARLGSILIPADCSRCWIELLPR